MKTIAKKLIAALFLFTLFTSVMLADGTDPVNTGKVTKISGQVVDQKTGETLAGVKVIIEGMDKAIYTDFDGNFQVECDLNKSPQISIVLISYEAKKVKIENSTDLKITLNRQE